MPEISIIVPIYKTDKYLRKCIESIINQTFTDIEIILVNDGSPDNCPAICDEYAEKDTRVIVIHKENGGVSSARNAGIAIAKGEYIGFVDSDDYCFPDLCKVLIDNTHKHDVDLVIGERYLETEFKQHPNDGKYRIIDRNECMKMQICGVFVGGPLIRLYKKSVIVNNGLLFDKNIHVYEDMLFNLLYMQHIKKALYITQWLYHRTYNPNSVMHSNDLTKHKDMLLALKQIETIINHVAPNTKDYFILLTVNSYFNLAIMAYNCKQKAEGKTFIRKGRGYYSTVVSSKEIKLIKKIKTFIKLYFTWILIVYLSLKKQLLLSKAEKV